MVSSRKFIFNFITNSAAGNPQFGRSQRVRQVTDVAKPDRPNCRQVFCEFDAIRKGDAKGSAAPLSNFTYFANPNFIRRHNHCRIRHVTAREATMSKLMFAFLLLCSVAIYNPAAMRDFARQHATELSWQLKSALYAVDRLMPGFIRFTRG
jgi:hypothetical protein